MPSGTSIQTNSSKTAGACNNLGNVRLVMTPDSLEIGRCPGYWHPGHVHLPLFAAPAPAAWDL
jgi:hypothetical protein